MIDNVYQGEAYVKSQCLQREQNVAALMQDLIENLGYTRVDETRTRWQTAQSNAVVRLGDDFNICRINYREPEHWFPKNTVVITDNKILFEPVYTVCKLPDSYWSIFYYQPSGVFVPQKDFHLSINRGCLQRQTILNEFVNIRGNTEQDYLNYNASGSNSEPILKRLVSFETANLQSFINLVIETYTGDDTITFSEKTFRALQTPAPWMLYACRTTISYLKSLGFDVLDDVIDHGYENTYQTGENGIDKIRDWLKYAVQNLEQAKAYPNLDARCLQAATHNQQLLLTWKKRWPSEFATWLPDTVNALNKQIQD